MKIFSIDNCKHCEKLKRLLDADGIEYTDVNVTRGEAQKEFYKFTKIIGDNNVPVVVIGKRILAPHHSFLTIQDCYEIIVKLIESDT
jgi:glutaredoxin